MGAIGGHRADLSAFRYLIQQFWQHRKRSGHGGLLHPMVGVDAETGGIPGPATGWVWARDCRVTVPHRNRSLSEKETQRWLSTAEAAKTVLHQSNIVTEISDRESDIYKKRARLPEPGFLILTPYHSGSFNRGSGRQAFLSAVANGGHGI